MKNNVLLTLLFMAAATASGGVKIFDLYSLT